jgi:hypothetical protein
MSSPFARIVVGFATLCTSLAGTTLSTRADIIQIPAIAFTTRSSSQLPGEENHGTLTTAKGNYYAAVPFTTDGAVVCRFGLVHRDNDADSEIVALLVRKNIVAGGMPFAPPDVMARVSTGVATTTSGVQIKNAPRIRAAVIHLDNEFYYVELQFGSDLLEALGVQIEVKPAC